MRIIIARPWCPISILLVGFGFAAGCGEEVAPATATAVDATAADGAFAGEVAAGSSDSGSAGDGDAGSAVSPETAAGDSGGADGALEIPGETLGFDAAAGSDSAEMDAVNSDSASSDPDGADSIYLDDGGADSANPDTAAPDTASCIAGLESCDGIDNDCDGKTDEGDGSSLCPQGKSICEGQVCQAGKCVDAGEAKVACDDSDPCTLDEFCHPGSQPCPSGVACIKFGPACKGGKAKVCNDGDGCTIDKCTSAAGGCTTSPANCADKNPCTSDSCSSATGCSNLPIAGTCTDNNACTEGDGCDSQGGCAPGSATKSCDDANSCTKDFCDATKGCQHSTLPSGPCDDGSACTLENCAAGVCKAIPKVCDDKNPCTLDSCDPAAGCTATTIAACTTCSKPLDCDDKDICTADSCTSGKCGNAPISGCKGPTDYYFGKLELVGSQVDATAGKTTIAYTIANDMNASAAANSTITAYLSSAAAITADSVKLLAVGGPVLGNFTAPTAHAGSLNWPNATTYLAVKGNIASYKFVCLDFAVASDTKPTNNAKCAPIELHVPDYGVLAVAAVATGKSLAGSSFEAGSSNGFVAKTTVANTDSFILGGPSSLSMKYSTDATVDASDPVVGFVTAAPANNLVGPGKSVDWLWSVSFDPAKVQAGPGYVCVQVKVDNVPAAWMQKVDDDTLCLPIVITKTANLAISQVTSPVQGNNGVGLFIGTKFKCSGSAVNNGAGGVDGFGVRCTLRPAVSGAPISWQSDFQVPGLACCGAGQAVSTDFVLLSTAMLKGATLGQGKVEACLVADPAAAVVETNDANNSTCVVVDLYGANLIAVGGQLGTSTTTVKRGVALPPLMTVKNTGNAIASLGYGLKILVSTDNKLSADDTELCGSASGGIQLAANGASAAYSQSFGFSGSCTVPTTLSAGPAYLIFAVDQANSVMEYDETDNATAVAVTLQ